MTTALRWISFGAASIAAVSLIATIAPGLAQTAQQWKCTGNRDFPFDQQIAGCTRAINSKKYTGNRIAWAYFYRGVVYYNMDDYDGAIADLSRALDLCKQDSCFQFERVYAYFFRGLASGEKKDFDRGIADYGEAIRLNPKYRLAYHNRGDLYSAKSDYERAIADFSEAIKLDPDDADTYSRRGVMYVGKGDFNNAVADFTEAIARDPKFALAYENRGFTYADKGDLDRAAADYAKAIEIDPDRAGVQCRELSGDLAIRACDEAIRQNPRDEGGLHQPRR